MAQEKKMKEINSWDEVPEFKSEAEEARFWATHSLGEKLLERMQPVAEDELPPAVSRTKPPISLRFDEDTLQRIKKLAIAKRKGIHSMLKEFVLERLYEEEEREGLLK